MVEPCCKKCGGRLEHKKDNDWICTKCGCSHFYREPEESDEGIDLENLAARMTNAIDHATSVFQDFGKDIVTLRCLMQKLNCESQGQHIDAIISGCQHSYELFCDTVQDAKVLAEQLKNQVTPIGGGHFELVSDMIK